MRVRTEFYNGTYKWKAERITKFLGWRIAPTGFGQTEADAIADLHKRLKELKDNQGGIYEIGEES
jgi:hypothetical protein